MKKVLTICFALMAISLVAQGYPLPIKEYDYAIAENNVSPLAIGMGGLNLTDATDPYCSYSNPALLADVQESHLVTSFRLANPKQMSFWEAASPSNALKDKQFKYFSIITQKAGFSYQPMSRINISERMEANQSIYYDYALDKVQLSLAARDDKWAKLGAGFNLKYLSGRLVYLREQQVGNTLHRKEFIDNKVKGFSTDVGLVWDEEPFRFGLVAYDLFSRLYWESYSSVPIQQRVGLSASYEMGSASLNAGVLGRISHSTDTTYHLGFKNMWSWGNQVDARGNLLQHGIPLSLGVYSHDFYGTQNINFTIGSGYNYSIFRFDFSLNSRGMKLRESEYLFSLGLGLP